MRFELHEGRRTGSQAVNVSLRRGSARRRPIVVDLRTTRPTVPGPSPAENHARWKRERAEARSETKDAEQELAAAVAAGVATYRRLRRGLDDCGARLDAVRVDLVQKPRLARGEF
jgi:hypothetical protein